MIAREFIKNRAGKLPVGGNINSLIVVFAIFLLGFIWLGLYYRVSSERQIEIDRAGKEILNFARMFEEHTVRTIRSADQAALFLKQQYEKEGRAIDIPKYINEGRFADQPYVLLSIIDENGDLAASSRVPLLATNLADREHFLVHRAADSQQLFISRPLLGRVSGKWSLQITRRINKPDGSFGGVAVVSIDPFYFTELYKQVDLGKNSSIALVGRDGIVRARQAGQNTEIGQDLSDSTLMRQLAVSDSGGYSGESKVDNIKRIYNYRALAEYPFVVLVGVDEAEVLRSWNRRITGYYLGAAFATVVICGFIIALLRVTKKQKQTGEALKQARDELEVKVEQRTRELFAANVDLTAINKDFQTTNQKLEKEITERRRVEEELRQKTADIWRMAYMDTLTGLPNRAYLNKWLAVELDKVRLAKAAAGSALVVDLDDLKMVNDVFGQTYGDAIIKMAVGRIVAAVGRGAFIARINGDEFIVIVRNESDRDRVAGIAGRIVSELCSEYEVSGANLHMSATAGIVIYPADGDTVEEILKNADNAMHAAKQRGKNCWRFYEAVMHAEAYENMILINSLRNAIDREELFLHYQPQVATGRGNVIGFEALIRWNSPEYGAVSPGRFIPLAEQSGLIQPIGRWVLGEACRFARRLADQGYGNIHVAVNVSSKQIAVDDFIASVSNAITAAGINPGQLELEITESVLLISMEDAIRKLTKLQAMGVRLSLDDFGTGYSSLTYLCHLPVKTLKIDKSFIDMLATDTLPADIIGSIITMAHILKMVVVAEGVETKQQMEYLVANGCDHIQGYICSRPLPETEVIKFLAGKASAAGRPVKTTNHREG